MLDLEGYLIAFLLGMVAMVILVLILQQPR